MGTGTEELLEDVVTEEQPMTEAERRHAVMAENRAEIQRFIRDECKVGDNVVIYPNCESDVEPTLGIIIDKETQSIVVRDIRDNMIAGVLYVKDLRTQDPHFRQKYNSFDHTHQVKMLRKIDAMISDGSFRTVESPSVDAFESQVKTQNEMITKIQSDLSNMQKVMTEVVSKMTAPAEVVPNAKPEAQGKGKN